MNIALWIATGILALAFAGAGTMKLVTSKDELVRDPRQAWAQDFSAGAVKGIGAAELLGAIGLILPALTDTAVVLVPVAAVGLTLMMIGAIVVQVRRNERSGAVAAIVLAALAVLVAWGRFGPHAF